MIVLDHGLSSGASASSSGVALFGWNSLLPIGVDIFFVISGFIMMLVSERESRAPIFLAHRVARIVPIYWFYTLLLAAGAVVAPWILRWTTLTPEILVKSLLFIPYHHPVDGEIHPLLTQGWTLQYEMLFYLLFATVIGLSVRVRIGALALMFAALIAIRTALGPAIAIVDFLGNTILLEFLAGMALYAVHRRGWTMPSTAGLALIVVALITWGLGSKTLAPLVAGLDQEQLRFLFWGTPALLVVFAFLGIHLPDRSIIRFLRKIGDASYTMYLCHTFIIAAAAIVWKKFGLAPGLIFGLGVAFPLAVIGSLIAYAWIEQPLLTLSRALILRVSRGPAHSRV
jgi:peptidoglycan/LPS O-acetylase OafA/YrhL